MTEKPKLLTLKDIYIDLGGKIDSDPKAELRSAARAWVEELDLLDEMMIDHKHTIDDCFQKQQELHYGCIQNFITHFFNLKEKEVTFPVGVLKYKHPKRRWNG